MIYIVNLDRTCKNYNFCHIYVLVVYKDTFLLQQFPFWPVGAITLKCICTCSPVGRYAGMVRFFYVAHMSAVSPSTVAVLVEPLSLYCTDTQQMQKAMSLQGHEDWVRGVAWASRSEWSQHSCISHKSNSGRSAHNTLNAVFRNDQFHIHKNSYLNSLKNTDCQDACVLIVVWLHLSFCQLCKPLQACTVLCVLNLFQLLNRPSLPVSPSHSQSMAYSTLSRYRGTFIYVKSSC